MTERMRDDELETTLVEIGERLSYPTPTQLASAVRARLREPRARRAFWTAPAFAPAFVTIALLLLVVAIASPGLRTAAQEFLHLRGIDIFPVPSVASVAPSLPVAVPGERTTLDEARRRVRFAIRVPTAPELGAPDDVFVETTSTSDTVTLVYRVRAGIPVSPEAGVSAMVVEVRGALDEILLGKATGPGTRVEAVTVGGGRGFWLEGTPHQFFYRDPGGSVRPETLRLAGNTLVWEQDGVTIRLEASVTKDQALQIAATFR
jgi:hypothetical protein